MRKSSHSVRLTLVAGLALSGCGRRALDPCEPGSFEPDACEAATRDGGYYYSNTWHSHSYGHPYSYYYNGYQNYTGSVSPAAHSNYARPSGSGTTRGMFGGSYGGHGGGEQMRRIAMQPRANWQQTVESQGLLWHSGKQPYWNESACYEFSASEVDSVEAITGELHAM